MDSIPWEKGNHRLRKTASLEKNIRTEGNGWELMGRQQHCCCMDDSFLAMRTDGGYADGGE